MYERAITGLILVVAVIHLMPVVGAFGGDLLASLYGIEIADQDLEILMRHRSILFGILGGFLAYAAFIPAVQPIALLAGFISVASFLSLAWPFGELNDAIHRVVVADAVAMGALIIATALYVISAMKN